jgi:excisionase family DNA binding protein
VELLTKLLTYPEVADALGVSQMTVRRLVARGDLPIIRVGRQVRFDPFEVRLYVERGRHRRSADAA